MGGAAWAWRGRQSSLILSGDLGDRDNVKKVCLGRGGGCHFRELQSRNLLVHRINMFQSGDRGGWCPGCSRGVYISSVEDDMEELSVPLCGPGGTVNLDQVRVMA